MEGKAQLGGIRAGVANELPIMVIQVEKAGQLVSGGITDIASVLVALLISQKVNRQRAIPFGSGASRWRMKAGRFLQEPLLLQETHHEWRIIPVSGACRWGEECYDYHRNSLDIGESDAETRWHRWKQAGLCGSQQEGDR